jgi:predicted ATPase
MRPRLIVLTGGPGAGKTAALETARRNFCEHVAILPEAAGIVFGGGFPRGDSLSARRAAQRAIFHVQREMERLVLDEQRMSVALCDRGTIDGAAYWPGDVDGLFEAVGSRREAELRRYEAVIHMRTPPEARGYDRSNPLRTETAGEAHRIDVQIERAWSGHPRRFFVESTDDFVEKVRLVVERIRAELPRCCETSHGKESAHASP